MKIKRIKEVKNILKPFGGLDVLYYYTLVSPYLKKFLKGKEIATKIWLPKGIPFFLKRGSKNPALYIQDLECVDEKMLRLRAKHGLKEVENKISKKQILVWNYFVPRKLMDFFYATNNEGQGKQIERIFIDIDKGKKVESEIARIIALNLVNIIKADKSFNKLVKYKTVIMWTGKSFHLYLLLNKRVNLDFYNKYIAYSKKTPLESFTGKWASILTKETGIKVQGGHEKLEKHIVIDPSGTPSGKLARCPFSLHMKSAKESDGIAVPLTEKELLDKELVKKLKRLSPESVLKNIKTYSSLP